MTEPEVLASGPSDDGSPSPRWRRWAIRALLPLAVIVVLVAALIEVAPWSPGVPQTGLRLLAESADGLTWIDVDTGARTPVALDADAEWTDPTVVADGVVVRYATGDPVLADRVAGYREGEPAHEIGEADHIAPVAGSSLWLVVDGDPPTAGGVALTTAFGEWRSRVFSIPARMDVVGATEDGLVVARGEFRYRRLQLWDVQLHEPIRTYGLVVGVREVLGNRALVTTGCLTSGCSSAVVDLETGKTTDVAIPSGFSESTAPRLTTDGVVTLVTDDTGHAVVAMGKPDALDPVDIAGLDPARGIQPMPAPGGWLAVAASDGDVALWRAGIGDTPLPTVELRSDERAIGVSE
jgi:hypothetical protein